MGVFKFPTPQPPDPHERYNIAREADALRSLQESKRVLDGLISALAPYSPQRVVSADGRIYDCLARSSGGGLVVAGASRILPFEVLSAKDPHDDGQFWCRVNPFSSLLRTLAVDDQLPISGLDTDIRVSAGGRVWLQIEFDRYDAISASIESDAEGGQWPVFSEPAEFSGSGSFDDPYVQDTAYLPLGFVVANPGPSTPPGLSITVGVNTVRVVQQLTSHLVLTNCIYNGNLLIYPRPHPMADLS